MSGVCCNCPPRRFPFSGLGSTSTPHVARGGPTRRRRPSVVCRTVGNALKARSTRQAHPSDLKKFSLRKMRRAAQLSAHSKTMLLCGVIFPNFAMRARGNDTTREHKLQEPQTAPYHERVRRQRRRICIAPTTIATKTARPNRLASYRVALQARSLKKSQSNRTPRNSQRSRDKDSDPSPRTRIRHSHINELLFKCKIEQPQGRRRAMLLYRQLDQSGAGGPAT